MPPRHCLLCSSLVASETARNAPWCWDAAVMLGFYEVSSQVLLPELA